MSGIETLKSAAAALILTLVTVGAAVGPARTAETTPIVYAADAAQNATVVRG